MSGGKEDLYIKINGSEIRYTKEDSGEPTLIFLHGFGGNLNMWKPIKQYLTCGRFIALDLIGFGGSDRPDIFYNLEIQRHYLLEFMDALKIEKAVLIGSSMGASIAAWTAAHSPDRVQAIVLFAPSGFPGSIWARWPARWMYRPGIINKLSYTIVDTFLFKKIFPNSLARQALSITSSYNDSFAEALATIKQPTLLIWSLGDKRVPFSFSSAYRKLISHAKLIKRPAQAGHSVATFECQETAKSICELVDELQDRIKEARNH